MAPQSFEQPKNAFEPAPNTYNQPGAAPTAPNIGIFAQPMVQGMALQYGQQLADKGTDIVKAEIEKYVPVSRLKYYFAVDTKYVLNKLKLLFFPFTQSVSI